jgi:hypothetical protein
MKVFAIFLSEVFSNNLYNCNVTPDMKCVKEYTEQITFKIILMTSELLVKGRQMVKWQFPLPVTPYINVVHYS